MQVPTDFPAALEAWREAALKAARARVSYAVAYAKAQIAASREYNSTESLRKATATASTEALALAAEALDIEAKVLYHVVVYRRGGGQEEPA